MTKSFNCTCYFAAVILAVLLIGSYGQANEGNASVASTNTSSSSDETTSTTETSGSTADESDSESNLNIPMMQLMNASSIEDALALGIISKDGHVATAADMGATLNATTGKLEVSGGSGGFARPDGCSPRDVSVEMRGQNLSPTSRLYPGCIKVPRCGGCCGASNVACKAKYVELQLYNLVLLRMQGPTGLSVVGNYPVEIERHITCKCECDLTQEKCGPLKLFMPDQCQCQCLRTIRCGPDMMFNPETCGCTCAERRDCCPDGVDDCVLAFDDDTCQCDIIRTHISNNAGNHSQSDIDAYLAAQQNIMSSQNSAGAQTTTTATTTPAPTTAAVAPSSCGAMRCPPGRTGVYSQGRCRCQQAGSPRAGTRPRPRPRPRVRSRQSTRIHGRS